MAISQTVNFCFNCGKAQRPGEPGLRSGSTPLPTASMLPKSGWERFKERWAASNDPSLLTSTYRKPQVTRAQGLGVWDGVKVGFGIFVVLPILLVGGCAACAVLAGNS